MKQNKFLIIDFDSTIIQLEALDELAIIALSEQQDNDTIVDKIKNITCQGMDGKISLNESLTKRLRLFKANKKHIEQLIILLLSKITPSFKRNSQFLTQFANNIYVVSSGFKEYIDPVVSSLGIKTSHVYANSFNFDKNGYIVGFDINNPLSLDKGKVEILKQLAILAPEISPQNTLVIGDGITDYEIYENGMASEFYAFTENISRNNVIKKSNIVIQSFDEFLYIHDFPRAISYPRNYIKILLLENIHPNGVKLLKREGYNVEICSGSLNEYELCKKIKDVTILGIRSKTIVSKKVIDSANKLLAIGAFCIGVNQIDLDYATKKGVCVFNAPFSNTRSVVEMVIGEIIVLLRKIVTKNQLLHKGQWDKSAESCYELRGKRLGIIGYGNIGSQLSVLAEALGMKVYYYDLVEKLQLGNAKKCNTLEDLLSKSDVITLHVDGRKSNTKIISDNEFYLMKQNVIFINLSRGHVVDIDAMTKYLKSGKILGVAIDVFPEEPKNNQEEFISPLREFDNVILTPHIGGSTEEAQLNIGEFVANRIIDYINTGDSTQSVNLPNIQLPKLKQAHRLIHLHTNKTGILAQINQILAKYNANVLGQHLKTNDLIGYVISDIDVEYDKNVLIELKKIDGTIKSRVLY